MFKGNESYGRRTKILTESTREAECEYPIDKEGSELVNEKGDTSRQQGK